MLYPLTISRAVPVVKVGDRPALLINRDITAQILISEDEFPTSGSQDISIIDPLGSMAVDGKRNLWAQAVTGNPTIDVMHGASNWAPSPAQVAAQINALGLMKDSTGVNINTTTGTVKTSVDATKTSVDATKTSVDGVNTSIALGTTPAIQAQTSGGTIANEIAVSGVPLLSKANNILNDQNHNLPANALTTIVNNLPVSQIGYEIYLKLLCPGGTASPLVTIDLLWKDSLTGVTIAHEEWVIGAGSTSGGSVHLGLGPTKGDQLTITAVNSDILNAMTLTTILHQNSRVFIRDDWRQEAINSMPGFTTSGHNQQGNCLAGFSGSIVAGATITRYVPLYAGKARISILGLGQAGNIFLDTLDPAINIGGVQQGSGCIYADNIAASGLTTNQVVTLPRSPTVVRINNSSGSASNYDMGIYIDEYLA